MFSFKYWAGLGSRSTVVALAGAVFLWLILLVTGNIDEFKSMPTATAVVGAACYSGLVIAILEIIDATGLKDSGSAHLYSLGSSLFSTLLNIVVIWFGAFVLFNYFGIVLPFVARAFICAVMATYIALPNTGDDLWLFGIWVFCVVISLLTGWISVSDWLQYQVAIFTIGSQSLPSLDGIFSNIISKI